MASAWARATVCGSRPSRFGANRGGPGGEHPPAASAASSKAARATGGIGTGARRLVRRIISRLVQFRAPAYFFSKSLGSSLIVPRSLVPALIVILKRPFFHWPAAR